MKNLIRRRDEDLREQELKVKSSVERAKILEDQNRNLQAEIDHNQQKNLKNEQNLQELREEAARRPVGPHKSVSGIQEEHYGPEEYSQLHQKNILLLHEINELKGKNKQLSAQNFTLNQKASEIVAVHQNAELQNTVLTKRLLNYQKNGNRQNEKKELMKEILGPSTRGEIGAENVEMLRRHVQKLEREIDRLKLDGNAYIQKTENLHLELETKLREENQRLQRENSDLLDKLTDLMLKLKLNPARRTLTEASFEVETLKKKLALRDSELATLRAAQMDMELLIERIKKLENEKVVDTRRCEQEKNALKNELEFLRNENLELKRYVLMLEERERLSDHNDLLNVKNSPGPNSNTKLQNEEISSPINYSSSASQERVDSQNSEDLKSPKRDKRRPKRSKSPKKSKKSREPSHKKKMIRKSPRKEEVQRLEPILLSSKIADVRYRIPDGRVISEDQYRVYKNKERAPIPIQYSPACLVDERVTLHPPRLVAEYYSKRRTPMKLSGARPRSNPGTPEAYGRLRRSDGLVDMEREDFLTRNKGDHQKNEVEYWNRINDEMIPNPFI